MISWGASGQGAPPKEPALLKQITSCNNGTGILRIPQGPPGGTGRLGEYLKQFAACVMFGCQFDFLDFQAIPLKGPMLPHKAQMPWPLLICPTRYP